MPTPPNAPVPPIRVAVLVGCAAEGRPGSAARWIAGLAAERDDLDVDVLDLAEARLPDYPAEGPPGPGPLPRAVLDLAPWLAAADAFVVVNDAEDADVSGDTGGDTGGDKPPAVLGNALDWYADEWRAKPVAFVGPPESAGLRAAFTGLHAMTLRESVAFPGAEHSDALPMLDRLAWWGRALRDARAADPYPG
ncbi:NADPH-dependent FMN reductase [Streptomyces sp. NPDC058953]|uniref:NADPH-dependent FMN reductase n=1 Tax=unclassified Streptomyces TaxID=2593676 RepID=UPI003697FCCE